MGDDATYNCVDRTSRFDADLQCCLFLCRLARFVRFVRGMQIYDLQRCWICEMFTPRI